MRIPYILLAVVPALLTVQPTSAQWKAGIVGGLNFADLKADADFNSRTLFGIGGRIEYSVNEYFSLTAEPQYVQKGAVKTEPVADPEMTATISYLELPFLFKYSPLASTAFRPYLVAGPSVAYRLRADAKGKFYGFTFDADLQNVTRSVDLSLGIGAGCEIPLGYSSLSVEARYVHGLVDQHRNGVFKTSGGLTLNGTMSDENWFKTRGIQLMAGIAIPL